MTQAGVSALWSLIDFILLCIRHDAHPVAGIIIDLLFLLATGAVGILAAVSVSTSSSSYPMVLTMEFPLLLLTAILHFVFFVRAIVAYRRKRRNRKAGYRPDSYSMHNGTAENLIPMENRRVLNGHSEF
ncbi:hypothetical protein N7492_001446 [Penicillium capsulatum]|uniref:Uncharacterized protein n=1 Tax=Penicillium capsulatum TaxID=69766 RepID=A0A9W9ISD5_9EURO|nr:hypothetical protein N7492_001446 [Penicillium capsulatum]KAJ6129501.1 hypothetical protein N7512_002281 [Penicillium capsulatum]